MFNLVIRRTFSHAWAGISYASSRIFFGSCIRVAVCDHEVLVEVEMLWVAAEISNRNSTLPVFLAVTQKPHDLLDHGQSQGHV